jgi:outer membrane protein TolC
LISKEMQMEERMPKTLSSTHKWMWLAVLLIGVVPPAGAQRPDAALPATGKTLDLESAVRIALDQNPLNRAASEGIAVAKEAVGEARAPFYPDLGLNAGYSRWERHAFLPSGIGRLGIPSLIGPTNDWFSGLATRYTLFDFGQRRAELKAAQAREGVAKEEAARVRQDIVLEVHQAYFGLVAALETARVVQEALRRAEDHLRLAKLQKEAGAVPQVDVVRAQVEVADAGLTLARAESLVRIGRGGLNTAMGLPVETRLDIDTRIRELTRPDDISLTEAMNKAVELRPEIRAAEQRIAASRSGVSAAKSAFGPKVRGEARFGWQDTTFFPNDKDWLVGLSLDLPLFDGFSRKHKLAKAKAEVSKEEANSARLAQTVRQEVWTAYSRLKESFAIVASTDALVRDAQESLRLANERYKVGAGTITDLLDSETALARAEATRVGAQWDYQIARAVLRRSVGDLAVDGTP